MPSQTDAEEGFTGAAQPNCALGSLSSDLRANYHKPRKSNAGRKPTDVVVMFKLLVLQQLYNISDEELEYQVSDRLSFMQFMDFRLADEVPDATTVWLFRKRLSDQGLIEALFEQLDLSGNNSKKG
ncbi:MAG: transposase [Elainella sp.]